MRKGDTFFNDSQTTKWEDMPVVQTPLPNDFNTPTMPIIALGFLSTPIHHVFRVAMLKGLWWKA